MFNNRTLSLGLGSALLIGTSGAFAAGNKASSSVTFNLTLAAPCTISTPGGTIATGWLTTKGDTANVSLGNVMVSCASGQAYKWGFGGGNNYGSGPNPNAPALKSGTTYISYILKEAATTDGNYFIGDGGLTGLDPSYTETNNGGTVGGDAIHKARSATGNGSNQNVTLFADIDFPGSPVPAGTYTDTILLTIAW